MILIALFLLGFFIALLVLSEKINHLNSRISRLENDLLKNRTDQVHVSREQENNSTPAPMPTGAVILGQPSQTPDSRASQFKPTQPVLTQKSNSGKSELSKTKKEWEQLIGGKLLNRIGALALIIGVGFFMKYAFDNNWISESVRVIIGVFVGFGTLMIGIKTHKKGFQIFSQGLLGAGIAILYLSIYASFNFYHLLPQSAAFVAMATITAIAFYLASRYEALSIALLGWGGGFLTPFLLSISQAYAPGLFGYLIALNLGMLVVLIIKRGLDILAPLSLAATAGVFFYWKFDYFQASDYIATIVFLIIIWGEYIGYHIICQIRKIPNNTAKYMAASFNIVLLFWGLFSVIHSRGWMATASAISSLSYLGIYLVTLRPIVNEKITQTIYLLAAIALATASILIGFKSFGIIIGWSFEAIMLIWCGLFWKRRIVLQSSFFLLGATGFGLLTIARALIYEPIDLFTPLINERALTFIVFAITLGAGAMLLGRFKETGNEIARSILQASCTIVIFMLITSETLDYFRHLMIGQPEGVTAEILHFRRNMILPSIWILLSLPMLWYGMKRVSMPVAIISLGVSLIAMFYLIGTGISYRPIESFSLFFNLRMLAILIMLGAILIQGRIIIAHKSTFPWTPQIPESLRIAVVLLGLFLLTVEAWDIFGKSLALIPRTTDTDNLDYVRLSNLQQLTLSGIWLLYSVFTMIFGLWKRRRAVRIISIGLFGISILKIFTYDLSFLDSLYRIFSFVGLGVILLAVSYVYQKYKAEIFGDGVKSSQQID